MDLSEESEEKKLTSITNQKPDTPPDLISPQNSESLVKITENDLHSNKSSDTTTTFHSEASFSNLSYQPDDGFQKAPETQRTIFQDLTNMPLSTVNPGKPPSHNIFTKRSVAQSSFSTQNFIKPNTCYVSDSFSGFDNMGFNPNMGRKLNASYENFSDISNINRASANEPIIREKSDFITSGSFDAFSRLIHDHSQLIRVAPSITYCQSQRIYNDLIKKNEEYKAALRRYSEDRSTPLYEKLLTLISRERNMLIQEFLELIKLNLEEERSQIKVLENSLLCLEEEKAQLGTISYFNNKIGNLNSYNYAPMSSSQISQRGNRFSNDNTAHYFPLKAESSMDRGMRNNIPAVLGASYLSRDEGTRNPLTNLRSKSSNRL